MMTHAGLILLQATTPVTPDVPFWIWGIPAFATLGLLAVIFFVLSPYLADVMRLFDGGAWRDRVWDSDRSTWLGWLLDRNDHRA